MTLPLQVCYYLVVSLLLLPYLVVNRSHTIRTEWCKRVFTSIPRLTMRCYTAIAERAANTKVNCEVEMLRNQMQKLSNISGYHPVPAVQYLPVVHHPAKREIICTAPGPTDLTRTRAQSTQTLRMCTVDMTLILLANTSVTTHYVGSVTVPRLYEREASCVQTNDTAPVASFPSHQLYCNSVSSHEIDQGSADSENILEKQPQSLQLSPNRSRIGTNNGICSI